MSNDYSISANSPAGIDDERELRLLICYFLYKINRPVEKEQFHAIMQESGFIRSFFYVDALTYLLGDNFIGVAVKDGAEYYILTAKGKFCAEEISDFSSNYHREKLLSVAINHYAKLYYENDIKVEYLSAKNGGYYVHIRCLDAGCDIMELKLLAPDLTQAELIGERVMLNPSSFYGDIMGIMLKSGD